jgi:hypothetical protein
MKHVFIRLLVSSAVALAASPALADVPPDCRNFDTLVNCPESEIGKTCPTGGICSQVGCAGTGKCYPCVIAAPDPGGVCKTMDDLNADCGGGALCTITAKWCPGYTYGGVFCGKSPKVGMMPPSPPDSGAPLDAANDARPDDAATTPPAATDSKSGCSTALAPSPAALAVVMLVAGAVALLTDRRRRRP